MCARFCCASKVSQRVYVLKPREPGIGNASESADNRAAFSGSFSGHGTDKKQAPFVRPPLYLWLTLLLLPREPFLLRMLHPWLLLGFPSVVLCPQ